MPNGSLISENVASNLVHGVRSSNTTFKIHSEERSTPLFSYKIPNWIWIVCVWLFYLGTFLARLPTRDKNRSEISMHYLQYCMLYNIWKKILDGLLGKLHRNSPKMIQSCPNCHKSFVSQSKPLDRWDLSTLTANIIMARFRQSPGALAAIVECGVVCVGCNVLKHMDRNNVRGVIDFERMEMSRFVTAVFGTILCGECNLARHVGVVSSGVYSNLCSEDRLLPKLGTKSSSHNFHFRHFETRYCR